ncbi:chloride channel protein [Mucilaginibacter sp. HMF5004]|uniref:chloride channel protein n=1 Tax=Mucilaginibacter rivuli TaxID=2857527 RepID=UPI001C5F2209|nr:chloride channel protein [Mucilaginibacter rivuli]MBW4890795.1 chloride channel protein [Mucilaginibacter rivuli]
MIIVHWLRSQLKRSFDRIRNEDLKKNALQAIPFWIASVITGIVAVVYAKMFLWAEELSHLIIHYHVWLLFISMPLCFLVAWWLVKQFSPYARGSGIPQVAAAIQVSSPTTSYIVDKLLSFRIIVIKIASSLVMAIGGATIGREGPTIQIAASVYKLVYQVLPAWWPKIAKRNMMVTGAAAGLAAAFNTPLGGIVFAIEELTKTHFSYFKTAIFSSVIIAGLSAQALLGPYLYLGFPKIDNLAPFIFLGIALVGIVTGMLGSGMAKFIMFIFKLKRRMKFKYNQALYVIAGGLVMAFLAYFVDLGILGSGKDLMVRVLFTHDKYSVWYAPVLKMVGSVISFTTGASGGVFAPALSAGAGVGSLISGWMHLPESDTNMLILAGMVGFLTGVTRSPFTSVILVLEMTDRNSVIFHLILAGMVASLAAVLIDKESFYDRLKHQYIDEMILNEKDDEVKEALEERTDEALEATEKRNEEL